jgi:phenylalanyl-tRNA synthetase beta chain
MLQGTLTPAQRFSRQKLEDQIKDLLAGWGLTEIVTYSFYSPRYYDYLRLPEDHPLRRCIPLQNPISEMQSVMRTTPSAQYDRNPGHQPQTQEYRPGLL